MLASEVHPWAKSGGLADVLAALPEALARTGVDVTVCLPGYRSALDAAGRCAAVGRVFAPVGSRTEPVEVLAVEQAKVRTLLFRADRYFARPGLYGEAGSDYADNAERFTCFCRAALEWLAVASAAPEVLHVHDWQAALAPALLRTTGAFYPALAGVPTVLTIHNLAYQGRFPASIWPLLNLDPRYFASDFLEFWGQVNFLKAGIVFADAITTVSPRYAREIERPELGEGLDGVVRTRHRELHGILNGIDDAAWNPATDPHLPAHYDAGDLAGKAACRAALQAEVGLAVDPAPMLCAVVSRLAAQKGIDLLAAILPELVAGGDVQLVLLGSGDPSLERWLVDFAAGHPGRVAVRIGFDEGLAHRIEAGADVFLMPSRYEPCGLNQLYSLRYGTVPVVHATGGLDDTVREFDPRLGAGTGFKFSELTAPAFLAAVRRANGMRAQTSWWRRLVANGMAENFSWDRAAQEYAALYTRLTARSRGQPRRR